MRGVFRLATGVYALGMLIRLLQRRSGAATQNPVPPAAAHPEPLAGAVSEPMLRAQPGSPETSDPDSGRSGQATVAEPLQGAVHVRHEPDVTGQDGDGGEMQRTVMTSKFDGLPRERLFKMAQANGHRLEDLITMSREDIMEAVAPTGVEQEKRSPVDSSVHDKITNRTPGSSGSA